ncbi:amino acid permease [Xylella taiwanensis]|uniref:Amino acid permease n=1 Tax=Xylella taiwanensis TaxID=1444770 RepID=Z9JK83_9GAMM|nr:amino acid permease [Xylella taiwanensis]AXI83726.1 amino acid permease [Xylella taiwanensis]EWS78246.1 amino acid permease [Xylella taiwanensis]MCD8456829.1 amino acid permease [Xylella taiwanensis]MCD8459238.1 amino acid permease [Xylella taiwanensis]MCD8461889.1 amino acid permease [Xylella taiwanensis]
MLKKHLFIVKPIAPASHPGTGQPAAGALHSETTLKRSLTARQLVMLGIGAVIGAGIFVLSGHAAAEYAGPAVVLSYILAGIACALAGLCYAEFSAMLPVSGSAYSYAYATLGEFTAWFIGWNLVLEYMFSASTVAVGWSGYLNSFLSSFGYGLPASLSSAPLDVIDGRLIYSGGLINLPAVAIVAAISGLCYVGITQSAFVNSITVAIKVSVIVLFIGFAARYVNPDNWVPFIPANVESGKYGIEGVIRGAAVVFFSYIGFDAVSTTAGEAKNPQRDMPIGILGSLAICTVIYIFFSGVLTGLLPYPQLDTPKPVATALEAYPTLAWLKHVVEIGAIAGLSSTMLMMLMAQPRIFYTMSQDGLLPKLLSKVHPKFQTPHIGTVIVGVCAAVLAGLFPISLLGDLVSMGTLLAFATVCIGIVVLRRTRPDLPRPFRVPAYAVIAPTGAAACLYLFWQPFTEHWPLMVGWTVLGLVMYFAYSYHHSKLRRGA